MIKKIATTALLAASLLSAYTIADSHNALGKRIYQSSCATCHQNGVAQAPKVHDQAAWQARYDKALAQVKQQHPSLSADQQKQKAIELMMDRVKNGMGVMPKGGMCNQCSDKDYKAAIHYMMGEKNS